MKLLEKSWSIYWEVTLFEKASMCSLQTPRIKAERVYSSNLMSKNLKSTEIKGKQTILENEYKKERYLNPQ